MSEVRIQYLTSRALFAIRLDLNTGTYDVELPHGGLAIPDDGLVFRIKRNVTIVSDEA